MDNKIKKGERRKVLFISPLPPPYYGSAMSSKECLEILKKSKNFDVRNIQLNYSKDMGDVGKINFNKIKGIFSVSRQIRKQLREFNPDIIYFVPATSGLGLIRDFHFIKQIRKITNKQIIFHIRSRITDDSWLKYQKKLREILFGQKAIVLDKSLESDLRGFVQKKDIYLLPNAIKNEIPDDEIKKIINNRKKNNLLRILFLSNMDKDKGWDKLLLACKILKEKNIKFQCSFVGGWHLAKDKKEFYTLIEKHNLNNEVKYLGMKTGTEKNKIYSNSDILVFPTEYKLETFGRVIIEAMMFGLPVIANGIAAIPTIIQHGKTGFVLNENSPEEIAKYIIKLQDKKLRQKMGREGRKRFLNEYEIKKYSKNFKKVFEI